MHSKLDNRLLQFTKSVQHKWWHILLVERTHSGQLHLDLCEHLIEAVRGRQLRFFWRMLSGARRLRQRIRHVLPVRPQRYDTQFSLPDDQRLQVRRLHRRWQSLRLRQYSKQLRQLCHECISLDSCRQRY